MIYSCFIFPLKELSSFFLTLSHKTVLANLKCLALLSTANCTIRTEIARVRRSKKKKTLHLGFGMKNLFLLIFTLKTNFCLTINTLLQSGLVLSISETGPLC